jgi:hypothetical protein
MNPFQFHARRIVYTMAAIFGMIVLLFVAFSLLDIFPGHDFAFIILIPFPIALIVAVRAYLKSRKESAVSAKQIETGIVPPQTQQQEIPRTKTSRVLDVILGIVSFGFVTFFTNVGNSWMNFSQHLPDPKLSLNTFIPGIIVALYFFTQASKKTTLVKANKGGFIKLIFLIIVALVILYYVHIPLSQVLATPTAHKVGAFLRTIFTVLWNDFLLLFQFIKDILAGK